MANILFADDDAAMRDMVADILTSVGHSVRVVPDGETALSEIIAEPPDLALVDYRMGRPDGLEVCRSIKNDPRLAHIPVLILTAEGDVEDRIRGFEAGANDYIPKPFDTRELLARVKALLRLSEQGRGLNPTTGLPGGDQIDREFERRRQRGRPFTLCYLDLSNFKSFNDRFGFATANAVIEAFGENLRRIVAGTDHFAGHIGGDDFVLMCDSAAASRVVDEIQRRLKSALARFVPEEVVQKGSYLGRLRNGVEEHIPLTRVTAALLRVDPATMPSLLVLGELAAQAKGHAKVSSSDGIVDMEVT